MVKDSLERLVGIVERVTYHNEQNGWSVLKVSSFRDPGKMVTVLIHQAKVYAGATMEFWGVWGHHPKHGEQFKAERVVEKKPATAAALEKYLGSGLIKGIGPAIAKRIVNHFQDQTLEVFESRMDELMRVPGIAEKKLAQIRDSWQEHRSIRDVMVFLQGYGISTLFATKIFKTYGAQAIAIVSENPYRLAHDIYGIGFFSADKIALAMGFDPRGAPRIEAGIKHVLAASRDAGHCFLTEAQIQKAILELLHELLEPEQISLVLSQLLKANQVKTRTLESEVCYYSKSLYFDELTTAQRVQGILSAKKDSALPELSRIQSWVQKYCEKHNICLSSEQELAVCQIPRETFSILTGGPGCGKTTCTKVLVQLLLAMKKRVLLAAPTGRAAQRMSEVIGIEAKTIHRLLEWAPAKNNFNRDEKSPLTVDFIVIDETSMLDISLAASLLRAIPDRAQVLLIGDPDQLPAVGAGNVLADLLKAERIPRFRLTEVFRQAQASSIIRFAHEINAGLVPKILSPLAQPQAFSEGHDCLFLDADEATQDQVKFLQRARWAIQQASHHPDENLLVKSGEEWLGRLQKNEVGKMEISADLFQPSEVSEESLRGPVFSIPEKFLHVDLEKVARANSGIEELLAVLQKVHPWSSLHFGLTGVETLVRLATKTIPEWLGKEVEIQVLTPQVRGTLGTVNLNEVLQKARNPEASHKRQIQVGSRLFREGDRVIQTRNNYDLGVFNGDIGVVERVDNEDYLCEVKFSGGEGKVVTFEKQDLTELSLAYAITIHKSQGSEFQAVIIPVMGQHFNMLFRNLLYTGLTRGKKLAIFVGSRRALAMAIGRIDNRHRQTALTSLLAAGGLGI